MDSQITESFQSNRQFQSLLLNDIREKLISKLKRHQIGHRNSTIPTKVLLNRRDIEELDISREEYFQVIVPLIIKPSRSIMENQMIYGYLTLMTEFAQMMKKIMEDHYCELLLTVAFYLVYEKHEKDKLLFKIGDKGKKFYIILQGSVDIIVLKDKHVTITEKDYMGYLAKLKKYGEREILSRCIQVNREKYPLELGEVETPIELSRAYNRTASLKSSGISQIYSARLSKFYDEENNTTVNKRRIKKGNSFAPRRRSSLDYFQKVTTRDYVQRLKINSSELANYNESDTLFDNDSRKLIDVVVYEYQYLRTLTTGNFFGEIALSNPSELRTASIITNEECHFGILDKEMYTKSIKAANEKAKRLSFNFICNNQLFSGLNRSVFEKKYFSYFVNVKLEQKRQILVEGSDNTSLFLIKEGEYDVYMKKSLHELTLMIKHFESLSHKKTCTHRLELGQRKEQELLNSDACFKRYYYDKKLIKLAVIKGKDMVGLGDYIWENNKNAFTVECKTLTGEVIELEQQYYILMHKHEECISAREKDFLEIKYEYMLERLLNIREMKISSFYQKYSIGRELKDSSIHGKKTKSIVAVFSMDMRGEKKLKEMSKSSVMKKKRSSKIIIETSNIMQNNKIIEKNDNNNPNSNKSESCGCAIPEDEIVNEDNSSQFTDKITLHENIIPQIQQDQMYISKNEDINYPNFHSRRNNNFNFNYSFLNNNNTLSHRQFSSSIKFSNTCIRNKIFKKEVKVLSHFKMAHDMQQPKYRRNAIEFLGRISTSQPQKSYSLPSFKIKDKCQDNSIARFDTPSSSKVKMFVEHNDLVTNKANSLYSPKISQNLKKKRYARESELYMIDAHYMNTAKHELYRKEREKYTLEKTRNNMFRFINKDNRLKKLKEY